MRKTLSFLLVLALAVCMLPGLALAEEAPTFDLTKDLEGITIPDDLVTCTCTKTNESKQYGQLPNGFSASKVIKEGEVWTVIISVEKAVYMAQFNKDTGSTHAPDMNHTNDFTTPIQFKLKYEGNKWMLDDAMPKNKTLHFTCNGKHLMPKPDHPTADAIDGLGKDIVGVVCANAPDKSKFYGLIDGGFSTTEPKANAENVYESTITLSPSAYCNQYNTDTGIEHTLNPNQTTEGLSFKVKYDPEKKMWMPVEEVKKMAIWVNCEKHEAQQPEMPMYPTTDNISGLNDKIVAVLCTKAKRLMDEKVALQQQLAAIQDGQLKREQTKTRLDDIYTILDGLKNRPMEYDEQIVRQLLECITVDSKEQITVIFVGGLKVVQPLID